MGRTQDRSIGWLLAAALVAASTPVWGEDDPGDQQHAVARISVMEGQVSVRRGDDGSWVAGIINAPLLAGDHIATGPNSRAEVAFDSANFLRLGGTAEIKIAALEANQLQVELAHGTVTYRVLRPSNTNAEVDTPNISVRPSKVGIYRISVTNAGQTELSVRAGDVEVFTPKGSQWVNAGQMMIARGSTGDPEFQIVATAAPDAWDGWCDNRDRILMQSRSLEHVPQGVYGAEELDNYGDWVNTPDYGYVWQPQVAPGWAPYQVGDWEWTPWYGWTWVSLDPWGWAPYHYGRWFWRGGFGWLWYPGVWGVPHYWSPALVGFFGFGGGFGLGVGFGFGFGNVGWVPLAPYEVFHPWWGRGFYGSAGYINRSITVQNVNIRNTYQNARVTNGVTGLSVHDFQSGHVASNNMVRPTAAQLQSAGAIHGAVPLSASGAATRFSTHTASYVPRSSGQTAFFHSPQAASAARGGLSDSARPPQGSNRAAGQPNAGARSAVNSGSSGWRRFGEPGNAQSNAARSGGGESWRGSQSPNMQNTRPSSGWQRFGAPNSGYRGGSNTGGTPRYNAPSYNAPSQPRAGQPAYHAPSQPHNSAPRSTGGGHSSGGGHAGGGGHAHR